MQKYILQDGVPTPIDDFLEWAKWFEAHDAERQVAATYVDMLGTVLGSEPHRHAAALVSTVFVGTGHNWGWWGNGVRPPILYETLVFLMEPQNLFGRVSREQSLDGSMRRYSTREEALAGHAEVLHILQTALANRVTLLDEHGTHWPEEAETETENEA